MTERVRIGQQRSLRMRRIGDRHMIVMPPQIAQVMSIDDVEKMLAVGRVQADQLQRELERRRMLNADLEQQIAAFRRAPIERDVDDPDVPQPAPTVLAALAQRTPHLASVPPPEFTAADS